MHCCKQSVVTVLLQVFSMPHAGILCNIPKSNHYKFPKNPYYRCMLEWNNLTVEISLIPAKETFSHTIKNTIKNPYVKVL